MTKHRASRRWNLSRVNGLALFYGLIIGLAFFCFFFALTV